MEVQKEDENIVYTLGNKIYINLTNSCTNNCLFCIRNIKKDVCGANLFLTKDNIKAQDVIQQLKNKKLSIDHNEVVFCGYGEPTLRLNALLDTARYLKSNYKNVKIRLNTNGHGNYINKYNIVNDLKGLIDSVSISLNGETKDLYNKISQPNFENAYEEMLNFTKLCVDSGIDVTLSIVTKYKDFNPDINKCQEIANNLGTKFRNREYLVNGY